MSLTKTFFVVLILLGLNPSYSSAFCPDGKGGSDSSLQMNRVESLKAKSYKVSKIFDREIIGGYSPGGTPLIVWTFAYQMVNEVGHTYLVTCGNQIESPWREGVYFDGSRISTVTSTIDRQGDFRVEIRNQSWKRDPLSKKLKSEFKTVVNPAVSEYVGKSATKITNPSCLKHSSSKKWPDYAGSISAPALVNNFSNKELVESQLQSHVQNIVNTNCNGTLKNCDIFTGDKLVIFYNGKYGTKLVSQGGGFYKLVGLHLGSWAGVIGDLDKAWYRFQVHGVFNQNYFADCEVQQKMSYVFSGSEVSLTTELILKNDASKSELVDLPQLLNLPNGKLKIKNESIFNILIKGVSSPQSVSIMAGESYTMTAVSGGYIDIYPYPEKSYRIYFK